MTAEEVEKSLGRLVAQMEHIENAQIVQGVLERRIEEQIDSLGRRPKRHTGLSRSCCKLVPLTKDAWSASRSP
jgi:hypothetical protein